MQAPSFCGKKKADTSSLSRRFYKFKRSVCARSLTLFTTLLPDVASANGPERALGSLVA